MSKEVDKLSGKELEGATGGRVHEGQIGEHGVSLVQKYAVVCSVCHKTIREVEMPQGVSILNIPEFCENCKEYRHTYYTKI